MQNNDNIITAVMKQTLYILISTILISGTAFGQSIRDTVFNDVIVVYSQNVTTDGKDFLIDMPIKTQKEPIVILNNDRRIPLELFFERKSFLSEQNELFLITKDWGFEKEIAERQKREGIHIKASRHKIYHIKRGFDNYQIDSLIISLHTRPIVTLNFKKIEQFIVAESKKYYYVDCIPHYDEKHSREIWNALDSLNTRFSIYTGFYFASGCMNYSLSALSLQEKLPAIKAIAEAFRFKDNDHLKDFDQSPKIYLPSTINLDAFDFYFESSKDNYDKPALKDWQEKDNTATIRLGYWSGDCCGGVPETERVSAKIINDTVYINYNQKREPNCNSSIGYCGNAIDFVINKNKYPNYKKLTFKTIE